MNDDDLQTDLVRRLSALLRVCRRLKDLINLEYDGKHPREEVDSMILRVLSGSLSLYSLVKDQTHKSIEVRHTKRPPDWDFTPWLEEKLNSLRKSAQYLAADWLEDVPESARAFQLEGIQMHLSCLNSYAIAIFEELCSDRLQIRETDQN